MDVSTRCTLFEPNFSPAQPAAQLAVHAKPSTRPSPAFGLLGPEAGPGVGAGGVFTQFFLLEYSAQPASEVFGGREWIFLSLIQRPDITG